MLDYDTRIPSKRRFHLWDDMSQTVKVVEQFPTTVSATHKPQLGYLLSPSEPARRRGAVRAANAARRHSLTMVRWRSRMSCLVRGARSCVCHPESPAASAAHCQALPRWHMRMRVVDLLPELGRVAPAVERFKTRWLLGFHAQQGWVHATSRPS